jgi:hypothetical protein
LNPDLLVPGFGEVGLSEDYIPHLVFHAVSTLGSINFVVFDKTLFIHINIAYKV